MEGKENRRHAAALRIQCGFRCRQSKLEHRTLKYDRVEELAWKASLTKRRERIERLEKELRLLEDLPAAAVGR